MAIMKIYVGNVRGPQAAAMPVSYVSLGDSIAGGHMITDTWERDYGGEAAQYGNNGNTETFIVPGCYTDIIRNELTGIYGAEGVSATSFARSGDKVEDLIDKLDHAVVRDTLAKADLVTVCIGANDVLSPAMHALDEYISVGSLSSAEAVIAANMTRLASDTEANSYKELFDKLSAINPHAKCVFTTIYNPYKYLHLEEGHHGFFGPLLQTIPTMEIDVDEMIEEIFNIDDLGYYNVVEAKWVSIELTADIDSLIKDGLLATPIVQQLFDRVNNLGAWAERYVTQLNEVLYNRIAAYQTTNPNISLVDTKAAFDLFPDQTDSGADVDYSDLVNVEFTATYDTLKMDWGALWRYDYGDNPAAYWWDLARKHMSFQNAVPSLNVWDYISFDLEGLAAELVANIVSKVIQPNVDPHPEYRGHAVLKRAFTNALGMVKYEPNGGQHYYGAVLYPGEKLAYTVPARWGHYFGGWYADASLRQVFDHARTDYADPDASFTLADLVDGNAVKAKVPKTTTLYAKWPDNQ